MTLSLGGDPEPSDKPFWAKCSQCAHCWIIAYLPMDVTKLVRITKHCCCPKCGDKKPVIAKQNDGILEEPSPKSTAAGGK